MDLTVEELNIIVEAQKTEIATQDAVINQLKGRLLETTIETKELVKLTVPTKLVTVDDKEYKWNLASLNLHGQVISAEDASLDENLLRTILAFEGQGILIEQV